MRDACLEMAMPNAQKLQIPLEVKAAEGEGAPLGGFEGYGSVFGNRDRDGDIVLKGAFAESLKTGLPALLWQHDQKSPIGRFDVVREDKRGLFVKGRLSMIGRGAEAYDLLKIGALNGLSIGFVTKEASRDAVSGARTIMRADLMEVSLVTFPANELARVEAVKSQMKDITAMENTERVDDNVTDVRSFERMLRDNGFSRSRAKAITAKGFRCNGELPHREIVSCIEDLQRKRCRLALEAKGSEMKIVQALSTRYGDWVSFRAISPSKPGQFVIRATPHGPAHITGPFNLEVRYVSPSGPKTENFPRKKKFQVPAGFQEVRVRAKSLQVLPQNIRVTLIF